WKAEQRPCIEDYLVGSPEAERSALLRELLGLELAYRNRKGESAGPKEYQLRFPAYEELIRKVFQEEIPRAASSSHLGRYRITGTLGSGGFGVVYKWYDEQLGRVVAIKIPPAAPTAAAGNADAFRTEARLLAGLDHPGIVPIYDVGQTEDGR